jgi:hypothetical protein
MWNERDKIDEWMQKILKGVDEGWVRPHLEFFNDLILISLNSDS